MPKYKITAPDGNSYNITAPDGASQADVLAYAQANYQKAAGPEKVGSNLAGGAGKLNPNTFQEARELAQDPNKSKGRKAWDALTIPAKMSQRGLQSIADFVPEGKVTGNMAHDVAFGTPKILAKTLAEAAPGFISRASMVTGLGSKAIGAAKPLIKAVGGGAAGQLESLSGARPGSLSRAAQDPTLMFSRVTPEAKAAYAAQNPAIEASKLIQENPKPLKFVEKARKLAEKGQLQEAEAHEARKAVDQLYKRGDITKAWKKSSRKIFDDIVKRNPDLASADRTFSRAMDAESLRKILPQNKYGGTSAFKTGIMAEVLKNVGEHGGIPAKALMSLFSPAAMGSAATGLGAANKAGLGQLVSNPSQAVKALQAMRLLQQQRQQADQ